MSWAQMETQWSEGELAVQGLLHVPPRDNPTPRGLPGRFAARVQASPLIAVGALDSADRPWTSLWAGEPGFARAIAQDVVGMRSLVDKANDPVVSALFGELADGEVYSNPGTGGGSGGGGRPMSALAIDLATRDRVKLAGRLVAGVRTGGGAGEAVAEVQLAMVVLESIGNCPKYLNKQAVRLRVPEPELVSDALPLSARALEILSQADMFFMSTSDGRGNMDTNHRGGPAGLVRVVSNNEQDGVVLVYPEFSGNRFYSSLGNLHMNNKVGIAVPDFATADVLYLTGTTRLLVGETAAKLLPHIKLAVRIDVAAAKLVKGGMPFAGDAGERSPYNPPLRRLATEILAGPDVAGGQGDGVLGVAVLKQREVLSPTIARYTFTLRPPPAAVAGSWSGRALSWTAAAQHVTLDFSEELDSGYSHMRDDDPQSLNDDFVRTFTVSNPPPPPLPSAGGGGTDDGAQHQMQITVRRNGPATRLMHNWNLRCSLEIPILGFGGGSLRIPTATTDDSRPAVFVATGVGITPLLSQAGALLSAQGGGVGGSAQKPRLSVLWSLREEDLTFAIDEFRRTPGLGPVTQLYVSNLEAAALSEGSSSHPQIAKAREMGAALVVAGRLTKEGLLGAAAGGWKDGDGLQPRFYVCAGPGATQTITEWLHGRDVKTESFNY